MQNAREHGDYEDRKRVEEANNKKMSEGAKKHRLNEKGERMIRMAGYENPT